MEIKVRDPKEIVQEIERLKEYMGDPRNCKDMDPVGYFQAHVRMNALLWTLRK